MNRLDFDQIKLRFPIRDVASRWVELDEDGHGACPRCGGRDRFYVDRQGRYWGCRRCHPKPGDVVDLVQWAMGLGSPREAAEYLDPDLAEAAARRQAAPDAKPRPARAKSGDWTQDLWQLEARRQVRSAIEMLAIAAEVREYLYQRGLSDETLRAYRIGARLLPDGHPCVVIPWAGRSGRITAIKWRRVSGDGDRYGQVAGGRQIVFGAHLAAGSREAVVVEGELNAMSVWQALGGRDGPYDVLSCGGDTNYVPLLAVVRRYSRCIVWLDSAERAQQVDERLGSSAARYIVSPAGLDANDVLVRCGGDALRGLVEKRMA